MEALRANGAGLTRGSGCSHRTRRARRSDLPLIAIQAIHPRRANRPYRSLRTHRPLRTWNRKSLRAFVAVNPKAYGALRSNRADGALGANGTRRANGSLLPIEAVNSLDEWALDALGAGCSRRTRLAGCARQTSGTRPTGGTSIAIIAIVPRNSLSAGRSSGSCVSSRSSSARRSGGSRQASRTS